MVYIWFLSIIFIVHYLSDFFVQVYTTKNHQNWFRTLVTHTVAYIFVMIFGITVLQAAFPTVHIAPSSFIFFIAINTVAHFLMDLLTLRLTEKLKHYHELNSYVNVIAFDQCIHYITLLLTFGYFFMN